MFLSVLVKAAIRNLQILNICQLLFFKFDTTHKLMAGYSFDKKCHSKELNDNYNIRNTEDRNKEGLHGERDGKYFRRTWKKVQY